MNESLFMNGGLPRGGTDEGPPHPEVDQWIAYYEGDLAQGEADRLRSHLSGCPACVATVLELDAFNEPGAPAHPDVHDFETAAAWRALKSALPGAGVRPRRSPASWLDRRVRMPAAVAASLLTAAFGLALWGAQYRTSADLRSRLDAHASPRSNVAIHDLIPNTVTRSGGEPSMTRVRGDEYSVLVMLPTGSYTSYDVEILDAEQRIVWESSGLVPDPELRTLVYELPPGSLELGIYRVRLLGGEAKTPLDDDLSIEVLP